MHDVAFFEGAGLASVAVFSSAFGPQATYNAEALGQKRLARVVVPHPIQDNTDAQVTAKAEEVYNAIEAALTKDGDHFPSETDSVARSPKRAKVGDDSGCAD